MESIFILYKPEAAAQSSEAAEGSYGAVKYWAFARTVRQECMAAKSSKIPQSKETTTNRNKVQNWIL